MIFFRIVNNYYNSINIFNNINTKNLRMDLENKNQNNANQKELESIPVNTYTRKKYLHLGSHQEYKTQVI